MDYKFVGLKPKALVEGKYELKDLLLQVNIRSRDGLHYVAGIRITELTFQELELLCSCF